MKNTHSTQPTDDSAEIQAESDSLVTIGPVRASQDRPELPAKDGATDTEAMEVWVVRGRTKA